MKHHQKNRPFDGVFWWERGCGRRGGVLGGGYVELTKVIYLLGFIFVLLLFR